MTPEELRKEAEESVHRTKDGYVFHCVHENSELISDAFKTREKAIQEYMKSYSSGFKSVVERSTVERLEDELCHIKVVYTITEQISMGDIRKSGRSAYMSEIARELFLDDKEIDIKDTKIHHACDIILDDARDRQLSKSDDLRSETDSLTTNALSKIIMTRLIPSLRNKLGFLNNMFGKDEDNDIPITGL